MPYRAKDLKLARMSRLLQMLGNPQDQLKIVHIAGTKGKGSTAHMLGSVFQAAGYRAGLFSSPHLNCIEERFRIDLQVCSQQEFVGLLQSIVDAIETVDRECARSGEFGPTYFEITTALAFVHFLKSNVDIVILEVGLGGRLDSTNVCTPLVSVITSISLDHTKQLGSTLREIATEKAGIIKQNVPVVSGVLAKEPAEAIKEVAKSRNSPLWALGRDFQFETIATSTTQLLPRPELDYYEMAENDCLRRYERVTVGLYGRHQAVNAAVAIAVLHRLQASGFAFSERSIRHGLHTVSCPARVEVVSHQPLTILDVAHNVASIEALLAALPAKDIDHQFLVFAATQGKDYRRMSELLVQHFDHIYVTKYQENPRGVDAIRLAEVVRQSCASRPLSTLSERTNVAVFATPKAAWEAVQASAHSQDLICVTGSFFIAAEIKALMPPSAASKSSE